MASTREYFDRTLRSEEDVRLALGFPVLAVPYDVPFIAITKAAFSRLANEELERRNIELTEALEIAARFQVYSEED